MKINFKGVPIFIGTGGRKLDPEKKNLIFIHGSGGSHLSWFMQTRYFAYEGYNVISPDFPGHGFSEGNPLVSIEDMSLWLCDLISNLKINDFHLIGHSQGCLIALEISQRLKKNLGKIIFIAGSLDIPVNEYLIETSKKDYKKASSLLKNWGHAIVAHVHSHTHPGLSHLNLGKKVMEMNEKSALNLDLLACNNYKNGKKIAKKLTTPSLIILGKKDLNIPIKKGREMAEKISNSKVVEIINGGHFLQSEFPEQVNNEISHFIN